MKTSARNTLFTSILAIITIGSTFAQTNNSGFEQRYRAKYGRPSPSEQVRLNAQSSVVASTHTAQFLAADSSNGFEQRYLAKIGRPTPAEEARLNASKRNLALPAVSQPAVVAAVDGGFEQRYRAKVGRPLPADLRANQTTAGDNLNKDQLAKLIAAAKTPAEHRYVASIYQSQAQHYLALSKEHEKMANTFKSNPGLVNSKNRAGMIGHCEYWAREFNTLAARSNELAQSHERMAAEATKM